MITVGLMGMLFIAFGVIMLWFTYSHFANAEKICNKPSYDILLTQPALKLWQYCDEPRYPFFKEIPCNCRSFLLALDVLYYSYFYSCVLFCFVFFESFCVCMCVYVCGFKKKLKQTNKQNKNGN